jgi:hypothetical protein
MNELAPEGGYITLRGLLFFDLYIPYIAVGAELKCHVDVARG